MLFHASLATPRSFPLFLLNCVQIGKFKICTQLTTRSKLRLAQFATAGWVCRAELRVPAAIFGNNLKNEASKAFLADSEFRWQIPS